MVNSPISLRTALAAAALLPVVLPAAYLVHLHRRVSKHTTASSGCRTPKGGNDKSLRPAAATPCTPVSLPREIQDDDSEWFLAYERVVSHPVAASSLSLAPNPRPAQNQPASELLRRYSQATHIAFSGTPQAYAIRASISEPHLRRSFDKDTIENLNFESGDFVNGVYKVTYHGRGETASSERVELVLEAPNSYKGHVPKGIILSEIRTLDDGETLEKTNAPAEKQVVFINETWMWRRKEEPATLIEGAVAGWLHTVLAGWLILRGMKAVVV